MADDKSYAKQVFKPAIDENAFEILENDFDEVINDLQNNKGLEKFKEEYEKIMRALKKSHESEKRLMKKCRELKAEIVSNSAKVSQALKLSNEDHGTMAQLKKEIETSWKMVDVATDKEIRAKEVIESLKVEIANLSKLVEQGTGLTSGADSLAELTKTKEKLSRDRDEQMQENVRLREQIEETRTRAAALQTEVIEQQSKISELTQDIQTRNNEAQRELRKKERMEREMKQVRAEVEVKLEEIRATNTALDKLKNELKTKEEDNRVTKIALEQAQRSYQITENKMKEYQTKLDQQIQISDSVADENQAKAHDLKIKEDEVNAIRNENAKIIKQREAAQKRLRQVEDQKGEIEATRERMKQEILALEREMEGIKKTQDIDRKMCEELSRERDVLNKSLIRSNAQTNKQINLVKLHEQSRRNLDQEIINYKEEAQKQRKIIYQLEKERDRYINEASDLTQKVLQHMEDVKIREMQIFDYKKKIAEAETKLRQQQNLYEAVRSDRNLYSKNLIEAQDEITEMKRKLKFMSHQIDQLKDEISTKEATLVRENLERQRIEKEKDQLTLELRRMKIQASENRTYIEAQEAEERKLLKIIAEADMERGRQKKELEQVISERDILGTQLVRRNDELALLYEKIRIQQSILNKGEAEYNKRLEDVRILKAEIRTQRRDKAILQSSLCKLDDLKKEVYHVQRELMRERTRCKALEEELENPMNVHRWRKLEIYYIEQWRDYQYLPQGSDPSTYEMIQKIHALQKRLIAKTEEIVEKELLIQEKEKLYVELKQILSRQPGPEVAEQLNIYQLSLKDKTKQMKALTAEANMYEVNIKEYKYEVDKLTQELQDLKKRYFAQKRREQTQRDTELLMQHDGRHPGLMPKQQNGTGPAKFTGGGFNVTKTVA